MHVGVCVCMTNRGNTHGNTKHQHPVWACKTKRRNTLTRRTMSQGALVRDGGATTPACRHAGLCPCITAHACRRITPHPTLSLPIHPCPTRRRDAGQFLLAMHTESAPCHSRRSAPRHSCPSYLRGASACVLYDRVLCVSFFVCMVPCVYSFLCVWCLIDAAIGALCV